MSDWRAFAARLFDIPEEGLGSARIIISGKSSVIIEQVAAVIEYSPQLVRLRTVRGCVSVCGSCLCIRHIAGTVVSVSGAVCRIEL